MNYEDTYSGDFSQRRAVIYTLGFTAKTYLFGPASTQKVVKTVQKLKFSERVVMKSRILFPTLLFLAVRVPCNFNNFYWGNLFGNFWGSHGQLQTEITYWVH